MVLLVCALNSRTGTIVPGPIPNFNGLWGAGQEWDYVFEGYLRIKSEDILKGDRSTKEGTLFNPEVVPAFVLVFGNESLLTF